MKSFFSFFLLLSGWHSANSQAVAIRAGHSLVPDDYLALRYAHWTNGAINVSFGGFAERSRKNNLDFSAYGADLIAEYASNREGYQAGAFGLRSGIGASWQAENEPWVYRDWPLKRRMSLGLVGELSGEWFMAPAFTLKAFAQQKLLFNPDLGRYRLVFGLGLTYHLSSY
ncbi:MAG: hypothetical protein V4450_17805 [Bacteroidota bacterium]